MVIYTDWTLPLYNNLANTSINRSYITMWAFGLILMGFMCNELVLTLTEHFFTISQAIVFLINPVIFSIVQSVARNYHRSH